MKLQPVSALLCMVAWSVCISATIGPTSSCCHKTINKTLKQNKIVEYKVQESGPCRIKAIVLDCTGKFTTSTEFSFYKHREIKFTTSRGQKLCFSPEKGWVKRAMKKVDRVKKEKEQKVDMVKKEKCPDATGNRRRVRKGRNKKGN